jgi:DNA-binding NtrC family response regulator
VGKRKKKELILIADDDPVHRNLLERILKGEGFDLRVAVDGIEAIDALDHKVSAVLLDLRMPLKSGMECLEHAGELYPFLPIIVISGAGVGDAVEAMQGGAFSFLQKPIVREHLLATLSRALEYREHVKRSSEFSQLTQGALSRITMAGKSEVSKGFWSRVKEITPQQTILCVAESGTNYSEIARHIHQHSQFKSGPFITYSLGSGMPENIEAELFGASPALHGVSEEFPGMLSIAEEGTILVDGLSHLPVRCQSLFNDFLQDRRLRRGMRGGGRKIHLQVVCRLDRSLSYYKHHGILQPALCRTLAEHCITIPPLRERLLDLPFFIEEYLEKRRLEDRDGGSEISDSAREMLTNYDWPGNIRELVDCLDRAFDRSVDGRVEPTDIQFVSEFWRTQAELSVDPTQKLKVIEKEIISHVVGTFAGNRTRAAESLGVSVKTVYNKLKGV